MLELLRYLKSSKPKFLENYAKASLKYRLAKPGTIRKKLDHKFDHSTCNISLFKNIHCVVGKQEVASSGAFVFITHCNTSSTFSSDVWRVFTKSLLQSLEGALQKYRASGGSGVGRDVPIRSFRYCVVHRL